MFGCELIPAKEKGYATEDSFMALSVFAPALPDSEPMYTSEEVAGPKEVEDSDANMAPWSGDELDAMARTLAGECYDHKAQDKRLVCEVILNRVSDGRFGGSVMEVLTAKNQFSGYWTQSRPVSENDYEIVVQALKDWYEGGCKALSEHLFFCAGNNLENQFRSEY